MVEWLRVRRTFTATVPVELELPPEMVEPVRQLFAGEYEAPYVGPRADGPGHRGQRRRVHALGRPPLAGQHDPRLRARQPGRSSCLLRGKRPGGWPHVRCAAVADVPERERDRAALQQLRRATGRPGWSRRWGRRGGRCRRSGSSTSPSTPCIRQALPRADIVKVDAEGSEGAIVEGLDLVGDVAAAGGVRRTARCSAGCERDRRGPVRRWSSTSRTRGAGCSTSPTTAEYSRGSLRHPGPRGRPVGPAATESTNRSRPPSTPPAPDPPGHPAAAALECRAGRRRRTHPSR
ncbi:MAG: hypothetical protein WKG07_36170 [Hymenobacter sp.]